MHSKESEKPENLKRRDRLEDLGYEDNIKLDFKVICIRGYGLD
jgi:hypothetical protein